MRKVPTFILMAFLLPPSHPVNGQFVVFREFFFTGQPPEAYFDSLGMKRSDGVYEDEVTGGQPPVKEVFMRSTARALMALPRDRPYIKWYDIEYLNTDVERVGRAQAKMNSDTLAKYIGWAKNQEPDLEVGIYSMTPVADIYISSRLELRQSWNDLTQSLADAVDFLCPSIYLYYPESRVPFARYAPLMVAEAKRLAKGKKVYAFVAPGYHPAGSLAHTYASKEIWSNVLSTIRNSDADGCVIFAGRGAMGNQYGDWARADTSGWWAATMAFMDSLSSGAFLREEPRGPSPEPKIVTPKKKRPFLPP